MKTVLCNTLPVVASPPMNLLFMVPFGCHIFVNAIVLLLLLTPAILKAIFYLCVRKTQTFKHFLWILDR